MNPPTTPPVRGPRLWPLVTIAILWAITLVGAGAVALLHEGPRPHAPVSALPAAGPMIASGEIHSPHSTPAPNGARVAASASWVTVPAGTTTRNIPCALGTSDVTLTDGNASIRISPELLRSNPRLGRLDDGLSAKPIGPMFEACQREFRPSERPPSFELVTLTEGQRIDVSGCRDGDTLRACKDDWDGIASSGNTGVVPLGSPPEIHRYKLSLLYRHSLTIGLVLVTAVGVWAMHRALRGGFVTDVRAYQVHRQEDVAELDS